MSEPVIKFDFIDTIKLVFAKITETTSGQVYTHVLIYTFKDTIEAFLEVES